MLFCGAGEKGLWQNLEGVAGGVKEADERGPFLECDHR